MQIAWCRRGPQDLPAVGILLPITMGAYVLLSLAVGAILPHLHRGWVMAVLADTVFLAGWYWILLLAVRRRERYVQTASAVFGLQCVLAAPGLAELWLGQWRNSHARQSSVALTMLDLALILVLTVWTLQATSHIVQASIERSRAICWILTLAQVLAESMLLSGLYTGY
jgi:hypothetical protein